MRTDHLLYIDITSRCSVGCSFCMYRSKHVRGQDLVLDSGMTRCLERLINHDDVSAVVISGEGEPFLNKAAMQAILDCSQGNQNFQLLTSGAWADQERTLKHLGAEATRRGDRVQVRISIDRFHAQKISLDVHASLISAALRIDGITVAVRSIVDDQSFLCDYLPDVLRLAGVESTYRSQGPLDGEFSTAAGRISVSYKQPVSPEAAQITSALSVDEYMDALSEKYNRPFTLGNMRACGPKTGLDITVKPDGSIYHYGAEFQRFGSLERGVTIESLANEVKSHPWLRKLYNRPFSEILGYLRMDDGARAVIDAANCPYWVVRSMSHESLREALGDD